MDRSPGPQAAGRAKRMQAVRRELLGRAILADLVGLHTLDEQLADELAEMPLGVGEVLIPMQQRLQLGAVVLMANERVGPEHRLEALEGTARLAAECRELLQMP